MLEPSYSLPLVVLSLIIATAASYTALDLSGRIALLPRARYRVYWLAGGSISMGMGIWSMHFVGMLAFSLPIQLGYDLGTTIYSLCLAIAVSYFALHRITSAPLTRPRLLAGGAVMGIGIALMHYTGMAAMQMSPGIVYSWPLVALSVVIAMAASTTSLWMAFVLRTRSFHSLFTRRLGAALVMGGAVASMHYTGMWAARFPDGSICLAASGTDMRWLAATVILGTISVLVITLILSVLDTRLQDRTRGFNNTLRSANEQLLHQATHDELTGLPNRSLLADRVRHAIRSSERSGRRFAVFFVDLDGFKAINDSLGHSVGDSVLKELAGRFKAKLRKEDLVARFGGDEFVLVVEEVSDIAVVGYIAEKLLDCFQDDFNLLDAHMTVSPSIGISLYPDNGTTLEALLKNADAAMYEVKGSGRNGYRFFEAAMNVGTMRAMNIQRGLRAAVANKQLSLNYQPKFDCVTGEMLGAEALLRWTHPDLGLIEPSEFIPIAERSGNIARLGQWVVKTVCEQILIWDAEGMPPVRIAVNLSTVQLRSARLIRDLMEITQQAGVPASRLMFEITESVAMQNAEENLKAVQRLQTAGFDLAIDDFGTGYSSLSCLHQFAVKQLKVDRLFVNELDSGSAKSRSIVSAIISLAHALNMEVVAEGVETVTQLAILNELKCDQAQGFLLARPLSVRDFSLMLGQVGI
jgi:diguanylate cyclase (GGDEF)-like protein